MFKKILVLLVVFSFSLYAQVTDQWKVQVGGMFVTDFETDLQIGKEGIPLGAKINTKDQLGLDPETSVLRLDGYYRFNEIHGIELSYFSVKSNGSRYSEKEFTWDGNTLSNVNVQSHFDMNIYKVNYMYSFYHNDKIELALTAGLHITGLDVGVQADGVVNGEEDKSTKSGASITAPLPVFGFKGEYTIIPNELFVNYEAEYFYIKYDAYKGKFISSLISVEYRFLENYGIGAGYNSNRLILEMDDGDKILDVENLLSGFTVYLSYTF